MTGPPAGWELSRPPTRLELFGLSASRWLGRAGVVIVLLLAGFFVIVGVPSVSVMTSPAYRAARDFIETNDEVHMEIGEVEGFARIPVRYAFAKDRVEVTFEVRGAVTHGEASVAVTRSGDAWAVTSASFLTDPRARGFHRRVVLVRGS